MPKSGSLPAVCGVMLMALLTGFSSTGSGAEATPHTNSTSVSSADAQAVFDKLWEAFERDYAMFVLRPNVDWQKQRDTYRPRALEAKSAAELADTCAEMLRPLRDMHIWLTLAGTNVPVFERPLKPNSNPSAHSAILGGIHDEGQGVHWAVTDDKIGFISIDSWRTGVSDPCQTTLEKMRDTRGLVVDVRMNFGGSEDEGMEFASCFLTNEFIYAYCCFRNGPSHTNLTEKIARGVVPRRLWRYDRPVVLLIGQKCISSNESFVGMMTGDPDLTTMGDHTAGSSGNPEILDLPLQMTVSVPRWIDYLPDGTLLDEKGFLPQVPFASVAGALEGNRDDLLSAALARLRQNPLPPKPISGPVFLSEKEAEARDAARPNVAEADSDKFLGFWETVVKFPVQKNVRLVIEITKTNASYCAIGNVPDFGVTNKAYDTLYFTSATSLVFGAPKGIPRSFFRGAANSSITEISGTWKEGAVSIPLTFRRTDREALKTNKP